MVKFKYGFIIVTFSKIYQLIVLNILSNFYTSKISYRYKKKGQEPLSYTNAPQIVSAAEWQRVKETSELPLTIKRIFFKNDKKYKLFEKFQNSIRNKCSLTKL